MNKLVAIQQPMLRWMYLKFCDIIQIKAHHNRVESTTNLIFRTWMKSKKLIYHSFLIFGCQKFPIYIPSNSKSSHKIIAKFIYRLCIEIHSTPFREKYENSHGARIMDWTTPYLMLWYGMVSITQVLHYQFSWLYIVATLHFELPSTKIRPKGKTQTGFFFFPNHSLDNGKKKRKEKLFNQRLY